MDLGRSGLGAILTDMILIDKELRSEVFFRDYFTVDNREASDTG